jgi:hypothetical protein
MEEKKDRWLGSVAQMLKGIVDASAAPGNGEAVAAEMAPAELNLKAIRAMSRRYRVHYAEALLNEGFKLFGVGSGNAGTTKTEIRHLANASQSPTATAKKIVQNLNLLQTTSTACAQWAEKAKAAIDSCGAKLNVNDTRDQKANKKMASLAQQGLQLDMNPGADLGQLLAILWQYSVTLALAKDRVSFHSLRLLHEEAIMLNQIWDNVVANRDLKKLLGRLSPALDWQTQVESVMVGTVPTSLLKFKSLLQQAKVLDAAVALDSDTWNRLESQIEASEDWLVKLKAFQEAGCVEEERSNNLAALKHILKQSQKVTVSALQVVEARDQLQTHLDDAEQWIQKVDLLLGPTEDPQNIFVSHGAAEVGAAEDEKALSPAKSPTKGLSARVRTQASSGAFVPSYAQLQHVELTSSAQASFLAVDDDENGSEVAPSARVKPTMSGAFDPHRKATTNSHDAIDSVDKARLAAVFQSMLFSIAERDTDADADGGSDEDEDTVPFGPGVGVFIEDTANLEEPQEPRFHVADGCIGGGVLAGTRGSLYPGTAEAKTVDAGNCNFLVLTMDQRFSYDMFSDAISNPAKHRQVFVSPKSQNNTA